MATRPVRIDLQCQKTTLTYTHNLPSKLITADPNALRDPAFASTFTEAIKPILIAHQEHGKGASGDKCGICGAKITSVTMTPMSFLHQVDDPFINIYVNPICSKESCELKTRQEISDVMQMVASSGDAIRSAPEGGSAIAAEMREEGMCRVCGKTEGIKKCGRCGLVAYCGKECQAADYKRHKKACREHAASNKS